MSIKNKLLFTYLSIVVISISLIWISSFIIAKNALQKATLKHLWLMAEDKEATILEFLESKRGRVIDFASDGLIREEVERINRHGNILANDKLINHLRTNKKPLDPDILMIHILDLEGRIIACTYEKMIGKDEDKNQPYFLKGRKESYIQDIYIHEHNGVKSKYFAIATPIMSLDGSKAIGVLMNGYDIKSITEILSGERIRQLGAPTTIGSIDPPIDIYIVNQDKLVIPSSNKISDFGILEYKVETEPVLRGLTLSEEMNGEWANYKGNNVFGATMCIQKDWTWILVVEQNKADALAPIKKLRNLSVIIVLSTLLVVVLVILYTTRSISNPVIELTKATKRIISGDLSSKIDTKSSDEIGQLAQSFNMMIEDLRTTQENLHKRSEELARSNEELEDFAYTASHDLKEPLRGIHNYSSFLIEDYEGQLDEEGKNKLFTLKKLSQRLEKLIDRLLYYSRVGRTQEVYQETDISNIIDEVTNILRIRIEEQDIDIRIPDTLPTVYCDETRIRDIFFNLITNAIKYNDKDKKWIEIGFDKDKTQNGYIFYVRDNGIGVQEKHFESIFKIFKRLHGRDKYGGGTGAGLAIVKKIVENHKGKIWVESTLGQGTTFYFTLGA